MFSSDLKVRIEATDLTTFPDASVVCGPPQTSDKDAHALVNPVLLVEVTSRSTEDYDRGDKLGHYKRIESLAEVVFVAHDRREVEVVRREPDGSWSRHVARDGDEVHLASLGCALPVSAIYLDPLATT